MIELGHCHDATASFLPSRSLVFAPNCIMESAENLLIVLFCHCLSTRHTHDAQFHGYQRTQLASPWICFATVVLFSALGTQDASIVTPTASSPNTCWILRIALLWESSSFWQNLIQCLCTIRSVIMREIKILQTLITALHSVPRRQRLTHSNMEKQFRHAH